MVRAFARVAGREVIDAGFVLAVPGERFELYPFEDDADFKLSILVEITDKFAQGTQRILEEDGSALITHRRRWGDGNSSGNIGRGETFATDAEYKYFIAFAVLPVGSESRYAILFNYMISREPA